MTKNIYKGHEDFKAEFGIHFKGAESELELVGGFLEDFASRIREETIMTKKPTSRLTISMTPRLREMIDEMMVTKGYMTISNVIQQAIIEKYERSSGK